MAWQLHYTSVASGPTGRAGFQFVAETPGLPPQVRSTVTPLLAYRPPPEAPPSPDAEQLAAFPVALAYQRSGGHAVLVRSRYLGRDYSGREGNFFAHAVVAGPEELEGLRPIELWGADFWADRPAAGDLAALEELDPGAGVSPQTLADHLAEEDSYRLLVALVDAAVAALDRGHGRVVLVGADVEPIVRWIAVLSYSLPVSAAARLSFTTYSADPGGALQRVVGTTPDVWAAVHRDEPAFFVDEPAVPPAAGEGGRFARTVAECWRARDFAGLDALGELVTVQLADGDRLAGADGLPLAQALDRAAALLALCRGVGPVPAEEEAAAAGLLTRFGAQVPEWVWAELVPALPGVGFDLALAMHRWARGVSAAEVADRCAARCVGLALQDPSLGGRLREVRLSPDAARRLVPEARGAVERATTLTAVGRLVAVAARAGVDLPAETVRSAAARCARTAVNDLPEALDGVPARWRERIIEGAVAGLAEVGSSELSRLLTDEVCDLLQARDWSGAPAVGLRVLGSAGRRHRDRRVDITGALLRLEGVGPDEVDRVLDEVWAVPASTAECTALLEAFDEAVPSRPALAALPSRAFRQAAVEGDAALEDPALLRMAGQVLAAFPADHAAFCDASVLLEYTEAVGAMQAESAAAALEAMHATTGATAGVRSGVFTEAADRLARRDTRFRAALLAAVSAPVRAHLAERWTRPRTRGLLGRSRLSAGPRHELVEVVLRMRLAGAREPRLESWAREAAGGRWTTRRLEGRLADPALRTELRRLLGERPAGREE